MPLERFLDFGWRKVGFRLSVESEILDKEGWCAEALSRPNVRAITDFVESNIGIFRTHFDLMEDGPRATGTIRFRINISDTAVSVFPHYEGFVGTFSRE